jgi:hypothetical protein
MAGVHSHVLFGGPKYPCGGRPLYGVPLPSAVVLDTLFPHQLNEPAGRVMQKNMITVATATPQSSAADKT